MLLNECLEVKEIIIYFKLYYILSISSGYSDTATFMCNSPITSKNFGGKKRNKGKIGEKKEGKKERREGGRDRRRRKEDRKGGRKKIYFQKFSAVLRKFS